jgi:ATP-dependent DNA helicase RecG
VEDLQRPLRYLKGVGEKLSVVLARKELFKVEDLLHYLPRTYEDRRRVLDVSEISQPGRCVVTGRIAEARPVFFHRSRKRAFEVMLEDASGKKGLLKLMWFRAPYVAKKMSSGMHVVCTGEVQLFRQHWQMTHPDLELLGKEPPQELKGQGILPVYSETEGLYQKTIRKMIAQAISLAGSALPDPLPDWLKLERAMPSRSQAFRFLHQPPPEADLDALIEQRTAAHQRLIYDEFFILSLSVGLRKRRFDGEEGIAFPKPEKLWQAFKANLPFQFTAAQKRVLQEVLNDMMAPRPMHRLVQGDVGSGKTVVAAAAALVALEAGWQVAVMAPTEILAEQHRKSFEAWYEGMGISSTFLSGSLKAAQKREACESLASGQAQIVFGTHALFEDGIQFSRLGLVIVDEQHRFGVRQRARLLQKGANPDLLVMTATPIPRTLALTVYGDLELSLIDQKPGGRLPIETRVFFERQREHVWEHLRTQLRAGRQAYIIFPLIEASEALEEVKSLEEALPSLSKAFPESRIAALHGRLSAEEKNELLSAFRRHEIDILASTSVVEVGVDVPNATVMVIEAAERFGLSQLHQLRGRVGRGSHQSFCFLMATHAGSPDAVQRLRAMEETNDGFRLAELDLEIRGPGEILGTRQSGEPLFELARLPRDLSLLESARNDCLRLLEKDPELQAHPQLREMIQVRAQRTTLN